jgi:hypothetical protein
MRGASNDRIGDDNPESATRNHCEFIKPALIFAKLRQSIHGIMTGLKLLVVT